MRFGQQVAFFFAELGIAGAVAVRTAKRQLDAA